MKKIFLSSVIIILILFASCAPGTHPITPPPTLSEGEGEEEPAGERVVLVELYNADGCKASALINPIMEKVASDYGTNKVILVELAGWGIESIQEGRDRFGWYVTGTKHTPFIAINGHSDTFNEGLSGGGGGGGGGGGSVNRAPKIDSKPLTVAVVDREYSYTVNATDADNDTLTYSLSVYPDGMVIDEETDEITWTPGSDQKGDHGVTVEVSDGKLKVTQQFTIRVYKEEGFHVSDVQAIAITNLPDVSYPKTSEQKFLNLTSKEIIIGKHTLNKLKPVKKDTPPETEYSILLIWPDKFPDATGYRIYKKVNSGGYVNFEREWLEIYEGDELLPGYDLPCPGYLYLDTDVEEGKSYSYYITAYYNEQEWGSEELETKKSNEVTIDTWLPLCELISPDDDAADIESPPDFSWHPVGDSAIKDPMKTGKSGIYIYDITAGQDVWWYEFDDMTKNNVSYNNDGKAIPLVNNHTYSWCTFALGLDTNANLMALSVSDFWTFKVKGSESVRRALLVGIGDYIPSGLGEGDLLGPPNDVNMIQSILVNSGVPHDNIGTLKDTGATKSAIISKITNTFSGVDADDISYFYFSGHGASNNGNSYLVPTDAGGNLNNCISVAELENELGKISGTKVVIIDTCHSGGFIGKGVNEKKISDYLQDFNNSIINVFAVKRVTEKGLNKSFYQVLTSSHSTQFSYEYFPHPVTNDYNGLFTGYLCEGCGYSTYQSFPADKSPKNGEITLQEAYEYTDGAIQDLIIRMSWQDKVDQDTQVYPENSDFVIIRAQ